MLQLIVFVRAENLSDASMCVVYNVSNSTALSLFSSGIGSALGAMMWFTTTASISGGMAQPEVQEFVKRNAKCFIIPYESYRFVIKAHHHVLHSVHFSYLFGSSFHRCNVGKMASSWRIACPIVCIVHGLILCCLLCSATAKISVYRRENGRISDQTSYSVFSNRSFTGREYSATDLIYLRAAEPSHACTPDIRRAPEHYEGRIAAKFVLLVDDADCGDDPKHIKLVHAYNKGYDGVIAYSSQLKEEGDRLPSFDIPANVADSIKINVDLVYHHDGTQLKRFAFVAGSSDKYILRYTNSTIAGRKRHSQSKPVKPPRTKKLPEPDAAVIAAEWVLKDYRVAVAGGAGLFTVLGVMVVALFKKMSDDARRAAHARANLERFFDDLIRQLNAEARGAPLTVQEVAQLRQTTNVAPPEGEQCAICQENYAKKRRIIALPCGHVGHDDCMTELLTGYSRACPYCRQLVEL
ncbi:uncharacterized protein LOC129584370 [Paramacrobiotus metropolitanus]|uniref:uncharacterized protein LOC129584370 n=1 Tax=Paramacrobiotus metropolitanus TaxID=2943436 RepID=UPI002445B461|nr:uncharacterized protein LOC129584370 [Paramacrobiotus metropolitanus]